MSFLIKSIGLVVVYLVSAKIGLTFGTISSSATIFWPPGGIALAAVLLGGVRYLPAVFAGAYLAAVMVDAPLLFSIGSSFGNTLETLTGYLLLKRYGKVDLSLNRTNDLFGLIVLGAGIPAMISAVLGPLTLVASAMVDPSSLQGIMWRWWRADVLGIAFFTPLILFFAKKRPFLPTQKLLLLEWLAILLCAFAGGQIVLLGWRPLGITFEHEPQLAWLFVMVIWAALRTGRRNTSLIQLTFLGQALYSAHSGIGFFTDDFVRYGLANFWMFAMLLATAGTAMAILGTSQRNSFELLKLQAQFDSLTKLPNRILFYDRFSQQLALSNRHGSKFAVMFIDLDKFKPVNDVLGHYIGDQLLIAVANRLTSLVREVDTVCRWGGDEFAILVSNISSSDDAVVTAEKLLTALNLPFEVAEHTITISASIGIAIYPDHGEDMHSVLHRADEAMYAAKEKGSSIKVALK